MPPKVINSKSPASKKTSYIKFKPGINKEDYELFSYEELLAGKATPREAKLRRGGVVTIKLDTYSDGRRVESSIKLNATSKDTVADFKDHLFKEIEEQGYDLIGYNRKSLSLWFKDSQMGRLKGYTNDNTFRDIGFFPDEGVLKPHYIGDPPMQKKDDTLRTK